ncbi:hybrid sensor histidine kinase/response regulator [Limnobacter sp.]|uniref:hybrid sensor histidine kinase/response regulator n=1 Tax=Limnobacter sp. TaxID=2003368 RepID=UPI002FE2EB79
MTNSLRYWQRRYKLIAVLLGVTPYLAYWFLEFSAGPSLSSEVWRSVALVTAFWSLNNLLVLVYFEYGNRTIKATVLQHDNAEKAREIAQRDLESLLNGVPYMLGYWDKSLHNRFSNKAYANWFSVEPKILLGKHISTLLSPQRLKTSMSLINKALNGEHCEYLVKLRNKSEDRPTHILVQYLPDFANGEVSGFYAIGQDISEKYRAEQNLILRTKLLELASEIAHVASIVIEPTTGEVQLTPEAQRLLHSTNESFADAGAFCRQFVCTTQQALVEHNIHLAVKQQSSLSIEFQTNDGQMHFGCSGESVIIQDKPSYLMCLMDITESTHAKTRLIEAKERADQLTAAKSQFVATMSHEIRNPLHTILGLCNLLNDQCDTETQQDLTEKLKYCTEDLVDLLTNSLDSFRLDRGELHFENSEFDLWSLIYNLSNHLYGGAKNHDLELRIELKGKIHRHWIGDAFRIKQMVGNLISNACKFTETGHIHLIIEQLSANLLLFTVNDTGPGIPKDSVKNLFDQLAQSTPSTARLYGGSGLGLNLVKSLVEHIGGTIQITSSEGSGTSATLNVPLTPSKKEDTETLKLLNAQAIQLAVSHPQCDKHARDMLEGMTCRIVDQGAALLITDRTETAHAHLDAHPDHRALILPGANGHLQTTNHPDYSHRTFLAQGPLQPAVIVKWLQSLQVTAGGKNLSAQTQPPTELVVLLVEDVKMTRTVIKTLLNRRGIQCIEAENGQKAVEIIQAQGDTIDFVLMDINMPVLNGIDATLQIRSDYRYGNLVVYALTGEDESTTTHSRDWSVFDKVLSKPLKMPTLEALLDTHRATKAPEPYSQQ